jgi:hypothetical protein
VPRPIPQKHHRSPAGFHCDVAPGASSVSHEGMTPNLRSGHGAAAAVTGDAGGDSVGRRAFPVFPTHTAIVLDKGASVSSSNPASSSD